MATVAELNVKIGADLREFNREMQGLREKLAPIGENFKAFGKTASTFVTAPLVAAGAGMLKMASDAQEMQTKFNVVFRNTGDGVTQRLDEFGASVGRSVYELKGMAAQLGDTLKPMGFTEDAAANLAVDLTKLATDLSSFNNMSMDEALRRLQGTLVGSHENALAFGVVINENTLKAQMLEDGTADLTGAQFEQAKVQARINLLMKGTVDAQGDAARTADGFANRVRGLQASLRDVAVQMGEKLIPVATRIVEKFTSLINWVSELSDRNQKLILIIGGVAAAIGPLSVAIGFLITTLSPWSVAIAAVIAAGTALVANWSDIKSWVETNMPILASGIGLAFDAIKGIFSTVVDSFVNAWDFIVNYFSTAVEVITGIAGVFFDVFTGNWSGAWQGIKDIFGAIWDGVTEAFRIALDQIKNLMPGFVQDWFGWTDEVRGDTIKIADALAETAAETKETAKAFSSSGSLQSELSSFTSKMSGQVAPAVSGVAQELREVAEPASNAAEGLHKMNVRGAETPAALDPASVSVRELGGEIEAAEDVALSFSGTMREFGSGFMESVAGFETLFGNIGGTFGKLLDTSQILINSTFPAIKSLIGGMDRALGAFGVSLGGFAAVAGPIGIFAYGISQMLGGNHTSLLEQGVNPGTLTTATNLGTLITGGVNVGSGLNFGFGDFSNLGGWQGGGQPAMITLNIDSRTIAEAVLPAMQREIELNIG